MLLSLAIHLFLFIFSMLGECLACSQNRTCPVQLQENFVRDSLKAIERIKQNKEFQAFLAKSLQKKEEALENKSFQEILATLQSQATLQETQFKPQRGSTNRSCELYIFVSFSLGEKALLNLAHEAKIYGATLVLRGFKDGSYAKTVKSLQKIIQETGQGVLIDPELFSLFCINVVPTYVLLKPFKLSSQERIQTPLHDRLQGHVSTQYVLEVFAKEGTLKQDASSLLENASLEKGSSK